RAARNRRFAFLYSEVGTERLPGMCLIARHQQALHVRIDRMRIEGIDSPPGVPTRTVLGCIRSKIRRNVFPLSRRQVDFHQTAAAPCGAVTDAVDDIGVE